MLFNLRGPFWKNSKDYFSVRFILFRLSDEKQKNG